jgi:poly(A) polymerase
MGESLRESAERVVRTLREAGHQAYLVGGCVRDLLLGREPEDYDVATDAVPERVMQIFPRTWAVGAQFGVVLVPVDGAEDKQGEPRRVIEVATFRSDVSYSDGRRPDRVLFTGSPQEDVRRRDFTINGLMMDPLTGEVLDFVGGREDLKAGIVRAIGEPERRFAEDKLRLLRALRFAARFGYRIDPATFAAIRKHAADIRQVSRERVRDELTRMLTEGRARRAFELMDESGLLQEVLPEIAAMKGVAQPPEYHPEGDVWTHTLMMLEMLPEGVSRTLAWGTLLHDVGKPPTFRVAPDRIRFDGHVDVGVKMAQEICRRLRMSGEDTEQIMALVANHMRFADAPRMNPSTLKRFFRLPRFDEHLELHRIDCTASHGDLGRYEFVREKLRELPPEALRPPPLLTGRDLIEMGYEPGPRFKEVLAAVEDAQLEGRVNTKDEARALARKLF